LISIAGSCPVVFGRAFGEESPATQCGLLHAHLEVTNMPSKPGLYSLGFLFGLCALAGMLGRGCSGGFKNAPVNARAARETLRTALESWKKGEKVNMLKTGDPPIYVIDMDWQAGVRLKDYQIMNDGDERDAHLFCPVKLTLQFSGGKEIKMQVTYIIATAPNRMVSRKVF
jgi:hypothetical protein